jgi:ribulose-phosphate 3-epimerase
MTPLIAPSVLAADWGRLSEEVRRVEAAGADWIHLDVMDGHFVPPITFGPQLVRAVKKSCALPLDVHLMITNPERQVQAFRDAGADIITVHFETCPHLHRTVQQIHEAGAKAGVSINPATAVELLRPICADADLFLIMSVNPGWGGQKYIPASTDRIAQTAKLIAESRRDIYLQVDGGINSETAKEALGAGANVLVAGTYIFEKPDYKAPIELLKKAK